MTRRDSMRALALGGGLCLATRPLAGKWDECEARAGALAEALTEARAEARVHVEPDVQSALKDYPAPRDAISPMRPEMRRHYLARQIEKEQAGDWAGADSINKWLCGAFLTEDHWSSNFVPPIRKDFRNRLQRAIGVKRANRLLMDGGDHIGALDAEAS